MRILVAAAVAMLALAGCGHQAPRYVVSECMDYASSGCSLTVYYNIAAKDCWYRPLAPAWQAAPADMQVGCFELAERYGNYGQP